MGSIERVLGNAMKLGISAYDSVYVTLAMEESCGLLSFDEELKAKLEGKVSACFWLE